MPIWWHDKVYRGSTAYICDRILLCRRRRVKISTETKTCLAAQKRVKFHSLVSPFHFRTISIDLFKNIAASEKFIIILRGNSFTQVGYLGGQKGLSLTMCLIFEVIVYLFL